MMLCPFCGYENIEGVDECEQCECSLADVELLVPATQVERDLLRDRVALLANRPPVTVPGTAAVREVLGANSLFGYTLIPGMEPATAMIMAPGAFFVLALMLWGMNVINSRSKRK